MFYSIINDSYGATLDKEIIFQSYMVLLNLSGSSSEDIWPASPYFFQNFTIKAQVRE